MVIYLDVYFIENFIVNFFLLNVTARITNTRCALWKQVIGATIGGIYSVLVMIDVSTYLSNIIVKVFISFLMCKFLLKGKGYLQAIKFLGVFLLCTLTLGGTCLFVEFSIKTNQLLNNSSINFNAQKLLVGMMLLYILLDRIFIYVKDKKNIKNFIYTIIFTIKGNTKEVRVLLDSGNSLREPATNLPVIIVEGSELKDIDISENDLYEIPYKVVSGQSSILQGIKVDRIRIINSNNELIERKAIIAFTNTKLSGENEFNGLLSRGVID